mgnify:CR=1 FL=1
MNKTRIWLIALLVGLAAAVAAVATPWLSPTRTFRLGPYLLFWPCMGLALLAAGKLIGTWLNPGAFRRSYTTFVWFAALILPLMLLRPVELAVNTHAMALISTELSALRTYLGSGESIDRRFIEHLNPPEHVYELKLQLTPVGYLLETSMPAIDIDGHRVFITEADTDYRYFHNDMPPTQKPRLEYERLVEINNGFGVGRVRRASCSARSEAECTGACVSNDGWQCYLTGSNW